MRTSNTTSQSQTYDPQGRLATLTHDLAGTTADVIRTYAYDQSGALKSTTTSNGSYDWNGHYDVNRSYTNNGIDAYLTSGSKTLAYDLRGNIAGDGTWTFTYDLENQLLSAAAKSGPQLAYSYDALGRLASRATGAATKAVTTAYLYDGLQLMGEYSSTGALVRRYIPGPGLDEPLLTYDGTNAATKTWLYADERGSVTAAANVSGTLLAAYSYGPFGEPNALTGVALRYTGQRLDPESGLSYYRARWYSPYMGRFLSPDPIGLDGGTHLYRYAGNDPMDFTDPMGTDRQTPETGGCLSKIDAGTWAGLGLDAVGVVASLTGLKGAWTAGSTITGMTAGMSSMSLSAATGDGEGLGRAGFGTALTLAGSFEGASRLATNLPVVGAAAAVGVTGYDAYQALKKAGCFK